LTTLIKGARAPEKKYGWVINFIMKKDLLKKQKEKLLKEKEEIEKLLLNIEGKGKKGKENVKSKYLDFGEAIGLEESADEIEEQVNILPVEKRLKSKLKNIKKALKKIETNKKYGSCEECNKKISQERLKIIPEARLCSRCFKK